MNATFTPTPRRSRPISFPTMHLVLARRAIFASLAAVLTPAPPSWASEATRTVAVGSVQVQPGVSAAGAEGNAAALYVTAKPVDNSFASAGKTPPLAAARYPSPIQFPFDFALSTKDLTQEFLALDASVWEAKDLSITARWDVDGVAATRSPEDLVGRGGLSKKGTSDPASWTSASVELQGRGIAGRMLTGGK